MTRSPEQPPAARRSYAHRSRERARAVHSGIGVGVGGTPGALHDPVQSHAHGGQASPGAHAGHAHAQPAPPPSGGVTSPWQTPPGHVPPAGHGAPIAYHVHLSAVSAPQLDGSVSALHGSCVVVVVPGVGAPPPLVPVDPLDPVPVPPPETTVPPETTSPQPQSHAHGGQSAPSGQTSGHAHAQPPPGPPGSTR